jgi:ribosomal protein S12 methylthiotransferase accessory factor
MGRIVIRSCRKGYTYDQDKAVRPEETVRTALEKIRKAGKTLIGDFYPYDNYFGMPQWRINNVPGLSRFFKGSNGKGVTIEQAQASCIMEFVERYSAYRFDGWFLKTWREFRSREVLPLECLANSLNYDRADRESVLEELKDIPLLWAEGYNYTSECPVSLPKIIFETHTTGLAGGNTMEEALLQAVCECVERHVGARVQWERGVYPTIDPGSIRDPIIRELIEKIEARNVRVILKDFSDLLGIPAVGAILIDGRNPDNVGQTIGVCTDRGKSAIRALTEAGQGVLEDDDGMPRLKNHTVSFFFDSYEEVKFLLEGEKRSFDKVCDIHHEDLKVELERCRDLLAGRGMEIICVDMTDGELELPAVWVYLTNAHIIFKNFSLLYYMGQACMACGRFEKALEYFEGAMEQSKIRSFVHYNMGLCHQAMGNESAARADYQKALEMIPLYQDTRDEADYKCDVVLRLGITYLRLGELEKADDCLEQARSHNANKGFVYFNLALCRREKGENREALGFFLKTIELSNEAESRGEERSSDEPSPGFVRFQLGITHALLGEYERALQDLESARALDGDLDVLCYHSGRVLVKLERWSEALDFFDKVAGKEYWDKEIEPGHFYFEKGLCLFRLGRLEQAKECLLKSTEILPGECGAFNLLGAILRELGDAEGSIRAFEESLRLRPGEWRNYHILGSTYARFGRREEGLRTLEKALQMASDEVGKNRVRETIKKIEGGKAS